jgi:DNA invertase Pin-like site-specific DNA recombinase
LHIYAALAEQEHEFISEALQAANARGVKLGGLRDTTMKRNAALQEKTDAFAQKYKKLLKSLVAQGHTLQAIADTMNEAGLRTVTGKEFKPMQVSRIIERIGIARRPLIF